METQCLPSSTEPKLNGTTTSLLPVTDMNLQIEKIPSSSTGRQRVFFHIGPRLLVDLDRNLSFISSLYMNERKRPTVSYSGDSLASSNGSIKPLENGFGPHTPEDENKVKKRVNICTEDHSGEMIALRRQSETSDSVADKSVTSTTTEKCLTMTGTIKRGKKAGQNLDVRLNISREELEVLEANIAAKENQSCSICGFTKGPHIFLWTVLCLPVATIISSVYSFYIGTLMWYNIFTYVTEEKNLLYRILLSPVLILLYPFIIVLFTLGLGFYAGIIQISWHLDSWSKEITDWEKGFYGWLCSTIGLEDCSPYEVVVLTDIQVTATNQEPPSKGDSQNSIPDINP